MIGIWLAGFVCGLAIGLLAGWLVHDKLGCKTFRIKLW